MVFSLRPREGIEAIDQAFRNPHTLPNPTSGGTRVIPRKTRERLHYERNHAPTHHQHLVETHDARHHAPEARRSLNPRGICDGGAERCKPLAIPRSHHEATGKHPVYGRAVHDNRRGMDPDGGCNVTRPSIEGGEIFIVRGCLQCASQHHEETISERAHQAISVQQHPQATE